MSHPYRQFPLGFQVGPNTVLSMVWVTIDSPLAFVLVEQDGKEATQLRFDWQKRAFIDPSPEGVASASSLVAERVWALVDRETRAARAASSLGG